jgi:hypothetical protein
MSRDFAAGVLSVLGPPMTPYFPPAIHNVDVYTIQYTFSNGGGGGANQRES